MLTDAIRVSGWVTGLSALEASEDFGSESPITDSEDAEECFENALISVATLFIAQVSQRSFFFFFFFCDSSESIVFFLLASGGVLK